MGVELRVTSDISGAAVPVARRGRDIVSYISTVNFVFPACFLPYTVKHSGHYVYHRLF
jgi:hypothetical protein